jgi:hypothetical protein
VLSEIRRKKFLNAFMEKDPEKRSEGQSIMKAYTKLCNQKPGFTRSYPKKFGDAI